MMHQSEWERLNVDEKLEHLRTHQVAQDAILMTVMRALEGRGVVFVGDGETDDEGAGEDG